MNRMTVEMVALILLACCGSLIAEAFSNDRGKTRTGEVSRPDGSQAPDRTICIPYDYSRDDRKEVCAVRFTETDAAGIVSPGPKLGIVVNKAGGRKIRILSYNVCNTKGMDGKRDAARTADAIARQKPDVVALQELDNKTTRSDGVDVLADLARRTGMIGTYGAAIEFQGGQYGVGLLSREKPIGSRTVPLPGSEEKRCLLLVEFDDYVVGCTHLSLTEKDRETAVAMIGKEAESFKKPVFVAGDFNAKPESVEMGVMRKSFAVLSADEPTWPAPKPDRRIDYIFGAYPGTAVSVDAPLWRNAVLKAGVIGERLASDHAPIFVDLNLDLVLTAGK